jgi:hypothetical protein
LNFTNTKQTGYIAHSDVEYVFSESRLFLCYVLAEWKHNMEVISGHFCLFISSLQNGFKLNFAGLFDCIKKLLNKSKVAVDWLAFFLGMARSLV